MSTEQSLGQITPIHTIDNHQLVSHAQRRFYASAACQEARVLLQALVDSPDHNTEALTLTSDPVSFIERHLRHLSSYPTNDPVGYVSNLKIMTSIRRSGPTS
jgi:hypothetical protein